MAVKGSAWETQEPNVVHTRICSDQRVQCGPLHSDGKQEVLMSPSAEGGSYHLRHKGFFPRNSHEDLQLDIATTLVGGLFLLR